MKKPITSNAYRLLMEIIGRHSLFDKHDNCFQASRRDIAHKCKLKSKTPVDRLMAEMKKNGLLNDVIDIFGVKRLMVNPRFFWKHRYQEKPFALAMFDLGSDEHALQWRKDCMAIGFYIDTKTGEQLKPYPYESMWHYRQTYHSTARTKCRRKHPSTAIESIKEPMTSDEEIDMEVNAFNATEQDLALMLSDEGALYI